jgi:gluconokinase
MGKIKIIYIMGVSGSGKSTIGSLLGKTLDLPYFDGDDYHPAENIHKMQKGHPLNDADRRGWLQTLNQLALAHERDGAVIGCSALKHSYRELLIQGLGPLAVFVHLEGSTNLIQERMANRSGHFMPPALLSSQLETLEPPKNAIVVSIDQAPTAIVAEIIKGLDKWKEHP